MESDSEKAAASYFYSFQRGKPVLSEQNETKRELREPLDRELSILAQIKDSERYPEIAALQRAYSECRFYRDWTFGHQTATRSPQPTDLPSDFLLEGGENLAIVANNSWSPVRPRIIEALKPLFSGIEDFGVRVEGGRAYVYLVENGRKIPAMRLSDGTLRYLHLLAALTDWIAPPPLIVIEEPELGLHPDVLPELGRLLREAAQQAQIIITTHSDLLVSSFSDEPEIVVVCEKENGASKLSRLDASELKDWLGKYSLGDLWLKGHLGGTRW